MEADRSCDNPSDSCGLLTKCAQGLEDFFGSSYSFALGNVIHRHGDFIHHDQWNNVVFFPVEGTENVGE